MGTNTDRRAARALVAAYHEGRLADLIEHVANEIDRRGCIALLDDRSAIAQANLRGVHSHDTLWLVVEAYATLYALDRKRAIRVVDDLLETDMYLPIDSGESLFAWAYEEGLLPRG